MRQQKIVSLKNLAAVNKLLSNGWEFSHTVGGKNEFALLTKYRNGNSAISDTPHLLVNRG